MNTIGAISSQDTAKAESPVSDTLFIVTKRCGEVHITRGSTASSTDPRVSEFMVQLAANMVPARTTRVQLPLADAFFSITKKYFTNK